MKKKIIVIVVAILFIAGGTWVVIKKKASIATTPTIASYPLPVEVAEAKEGSIFMSSHYLGTIVPLNFADISPRITGNILSVAVREGDRVKKGQSLVTIDDRALKEREHAQMLDVAGTESQLVGASSVYDAQQAVYERDQMLYKEGAISLEALQRSKAQRDSAYAQVKSVEEKVKALRKIAQSASVETSYSRLHSPIDGVVTKRLQEPGDLAIPGKPVLKVEGTSNFKVVVQVPEVDMPLINKGRRTVLSNVSSRFESTVSRVYPAVAAGTLGTIEIDVAKRPFNIVSGGTVGVDVITGKTDQGIVLPLNSLLETPKGVFVFKAEKTEEGKPAMVKVIPVQVLGKNSESACVKGDIKSGESVVTGDEGKLLRLSDGMTILPAKPPGVGK
ncbi:MAG TPA: efflux RND transporter periplasmic adaptor subunit [Syntrophales bacterium]|nr:efflux RND transporter periplasmic adaptor subunit [Syntrophales bacterium]